MFGTSRLVTPLRRWPVESQLQARRNAMVASTALAQRRAEREDVEEFFAALGKDTAPALSQPVVARAELVAHG